MKKPQKPIRLVQQQSGFFVRTNTIPPRDEFTQRGRSGANRIWFGGAIDFTIGNASGQLSLWSKGLHNGSPESLQHQIPIPTSEFKYTIFNLILINTD